MKLIYQLTFTALLFSSFNLFAQDAAELPAADPIPAPAVEEAEEDEDDALKISGFVDAYYQNIFSSDANDNALAFPTSFTPEDGGFSVGMVNLLVEKSIGKVGMVGQVGFGPRANAANGDFPNLQQLYVTYSPSEAVTFTLGQFGTFVGYEVIDAPVNVNYSTSYLFSYGPFFHTGLKADFAIAEGFGAMVGVFNNTDSRFNAPGYYYGAQLSAEVGGLAAYLNVLTGTDEQDVIGEEDATTFQVDLTATYEISESFMLGINASDKSTSLDGNSGDGFTGVALYATAGLTDNFSLNLRAESFTEKAPDGITLDGRSVFAITASGNITLGDGFVLIPEVRFDSSSDFANTYSGGIIDFGGAAEDDSIATFILAGVYAF